MASFKEYADALPLYGTEASKNWARTLRSDMASRLDRIKIGGLALIVREIAKNEDCLAMGCITADHFHKLMSDIGLKILSVSDSMHWIKSREKRVGELVHEAYWELQKEYSQTKPF